jgi:uncharacterized protein YcbX
MRVARAWRYPVKSLLGQSTEFIDVVAGGVAGDRRYAIREASGKLGSGKNTDRFRKIDGLFRYHARYEGERAIVTFPDGTAMDADDPGIGAMLSAALGQPVSLEREDDGAYVDDGQLHLLTTASLDWLQRTLPDVPADERRFRPNLVLDCPGDEPVEQDWIGCTLRIGEEVVLRIVAPTERCGMIAFEQDGGVAREPRVLRHITHNAGLLFGVYADIVSPGRIRVGDAVTLESGDRTASASAGT